VASKKVSVEELLIARLDDSDLLTDPGGLCSEPTLKAISRCQFTTPAPKKDAGINEQRSVLERRHGRHRGSARLPAESGVYPLSA
jgi:hypothetical protein